MRALVYRDVGSVEIREVPDPRIEAPDDALVRITRSAICGSDLHFLRGKTPLEPGDVMGHEAAGVVTEVGPQVRGVHPGQRVAVSFVFGCGACWFCRHGMTSLCDDLAMPGTGLFGGDLPGAQAERIRVPHADVNLLSLPQDVDDDRAVFLGDVLTTGLYGAATAGIGEGDSVAVVGAGPVGLFVTQAARNRGAAQVFVLDRDRPRLTLAAGLGAVPVDVDAANAEVEICDRTGGRGADVVVEAVGHPSAFRSALEVVRRGGSVTVLGIYAGETVRAQLGVWGARALDVRFAGICPVHAWWGEALEHVRAGRMDPSPVISHRLALEDAPFGYELFDTRAATKVLLSP